MQNNRLSIILCQSLKIETHVNQLYYWLTKKIMDKTKADFQLPFSR